jgi:predicted ATPase
MALPHRAERERNPLFIERITIDPGREHTGGWPFTLPPVEYLADHGLAFNRPITFLVGENGSGKSTLVEAIADAVKINAEGGKAGTRYASTGSKTLLGEVVTAALTPAGLRLVGGPRRARNGFFLRAETLFNLGRNVSGRYGFWEQDLETQSHGEGFFTVFGAMFKPPGLFLLDEPEAALSFSSCLQLVGLLHDLAEAGSQVICATHSPILAATPGAEIIEVGDHGLRHTAWDELDIVDHFRRYLANPHSYLRHLIQPEP